ncbi:MAG: urea transporter [Bacteroidales bacterium]|nr:urea transporter [Bacteroidales bacterium]
MDNTFSIKKITYTILNSYSQIFFSENKLFAALLIPVSFLDIWAGSSGLLAVLTANITAYMLGYNKLSIQKGVYGFNALLVGLGTGLSFSPGLELFIVVFFASILTLFITIAIQGILSKYALPYLSIPFLLGIWAVILATKDFTALGLSERGIYTYNELYALGGINFVDFYDWFSNLNFPESLRIYFLSLGAIFFQNNILAGILISVGLLYYSRIAFSLSLLGFFAAFLFYKFLGADFSELGYTFIGFNYILTSIAVGSYFVLPSWRSYLWTILLLPVTVIITAGLAKVFSVWFLSVYSLPFNIIVIMFIYVLKLRSTNRQHLTDNFVKQSTPEKTIYLNKTAIEENKSKLFFPISLPFWGEWSVMQAHDGEYTHKEEWKHAWDFVIIDKNEKQFKNKGNLVEDYYCYGKSIIAAADGIISDIFDGIDDNKAGEINTVKNWGNSIVIKHTELLYTQISHIKKDSFKVKKGDFVRKGDVLAVVGNSGHSPYPHLHFQIQATPFVGSKTLDYPIYNYILNNENSQELITFSKPELNQIISPAESDEILRDAFNFTPGQKIQAEVEINNKMKVYTWEIYKTVYNETYFYCPLTKSTAYYYSEDAGFYFKNYYGNKKSALFSFYKSLYSVKKTYCKDIQHNSCIRSDLFYGKLFVIIQDFFAPFYLFLKTKYKLNYIEKDDDLSAEFIELNSTIQKSIFSKKTNTSFSDILIKQNGEIIVQIKEKESKIKLHLTP